MSPRAMKGVVIATVVAAMFCGLIAYSVITKRHSDEAIADWGKDTPSEKPTKEPVAISEQDAAAALLRGRVHLDSLSAEMKKNGIDARFEVRDVANEVWYVGLCDEKITIDLALRLNDSLSSFGFKTLRCASHVAYLH